MEGTVEKLAFGAKGIVRLKNRFVVFVPYTLPHEEIRFEITHKKKTYSEGRLLEVLRANPERIIPLCPYYGVCGGCQLQHAAYSLQIEYKRACVQEALNFVFPDVPVSIVPADPIWAYRQHITLTLRPSSHGFAMGYLSNDNSTLIEVEICPIFQSPHDPIVLHCKNLVKNLTASDLNSGKLKVIKTEDSNYILSFSFKQQPDNFEEVASQYLGKGIRGITASAPGQNRTLGNTHLMFKIEELTFRHHPDAFLQNHFQMSQLIYMHIRDKVREFSPKILLDLYCGIGVSSLLASPYAKKIYGVEKNRNGISMAEKNAAKNQIYNVSFVAQSVEEALPELLKQKPEMAIINPPRTGLSPHAAEKICSSTIRQAIYISCHPASQMRDLKIFKQSGFTVTKAQAYDMFPQTGHVESLVCIAR